MKHPESGPLKERELGKPYSRLIVNIIPKHGDAGAVKKMYNYNRHLSSKHSDISHSAKIYNYNSKVFHHLPPPVLCGVEVEYEISKFRTYKFVYTKKNAYIRAGHVHIFVCTYPHVANTKKIK